MDWLVWLIGGLLLIAAEVATGGLWLLMIGLGALAGSGAAALGASPLAGTAVFAIVSLGLVTVARPVVRRRLHTGEHLRTNVDALIGGRAITLSTVDAEGGRVKIGGEVWSARTYDATQVIEPGSPVMVMEISGATAVVWTDPAQTGGPVPESPER
jgi:membrane protein implicated in regulation of membrane protease activity